GETGSVRKQPHRKWIFERLLNLFEIERTVQIERRLIPVKIHGLKNFVVGLCRKLCRKAARADKGQRQSFRQILKFRLYGCWPCHVFTMSIHGMSRRLNVKTAKVQII